MLVYTIFFLNYYAHRFWRFLLPDDSSVFLFFCLFDLSSWTFLLKFAAFSEKTRFVPESKQSLQIDNDSLRFVINY